MSNLTRNTLLACADCGELKLEELEISWFPGLFIKLMSLATLSFLTTAANLFMIYIACKTKSIVSNTKVFFISLAVAHLLGSIIVIPIWIITRLFAEIAIHSSTFCQAAAYVWILMILASFYSLSALSLDRFLIISNPMRYPVKATTSRKLGAIAATWIFCMLFAAAPFAGWGEYKFQADAIPICGLNMKYSLSFTIVLIAFGFGFPLCVDIFCCGNIISIARRQSLSIEERKSSSGSNSSIASTVTSSSTSNIAQQPKMSKLKQKLNALRLVFAGTGSFLVCWVPYLGAHIWMITQRKLGHDAMSMPYILEFVVMCVALLNGFVNPVVIMVSNRDFRRRIKLVLFRRFGMFNLDISDERSDSSNNGCSRKMKSQDTTTQEAFHTENQHMSDSEALSANNEPVSQSANPVTTTDSSNSNISKDSSGTNKLPATIIVHIHECRRLMSQISIREMETTVFLDNNVNEVKRSKSAHDIYNCFDRNGICIK